MNNRNRDSLNLPWGMTVSIPHFLAAAFNARIKKLPQELLLPNISEMHIPEHAYAPVHEELSEYLPDDFGDVLIWGSIVYPLYPVKPANYIISSNDWFLLQNFQEILISTPQGIGIFGRVNEILRFGMDMFIETFEPANIPPTTIPVSELLSEEEILKRIKEDPQSITSTTIFESLESDKHVQLRSWFAQHGAAIARYIQFHTTVGSLSVLTSLTGGEVMNITFNHRYPKTITFYPYSHKKFISLIESILPKKE